MDRGSKRAYTVVGTLHWVMNKKSMDRHDNSHNTPFSDEEYSLDYRSLQDD